MRDVVGFLILVGGVLFSLLLVWFGLRIYGQNQPISDYHTPLVEELLKQPAPISWENLPTAQWPLLRIFFQEDQWKLENGKDWTTAFSSLGPKPLLLFFEGRDAKALPQLRREMNQSGLWKNTIFCSRQDGLLKDLRELEPKWTYCSGEGYLIRMLAFSSLGLESLLQMPSDVVFVHLSTTLANQEVDNIIKEGQRRNKFVIVGPVTRPLEGLSPQGWMVENKDPKVQ